MAAVQKKVKKGRPIPNEDLMIKPLPTRASKIKNPPLMEAIGIKHPFSMGIFGASGSGKTVLCMNLFLKKGYFNKYFDEIYLLTPTGGADDTFKQLGLPENQIITKNFIGALEEIIAKQEREVADKGVAEAEKVCVIFEDLTSLKKLMNSPAFLQAFVQNRHLNMSSIAVCHKYNALERTARLNCNHAMLFPCTGSEKKVLKDEHSTHLMEGKAFDRMLTTAFQPEPDMPRPFLHINGKAPIEQRFRKSFSYILGGQR